MVLRQTKGKGVDIVLNSLSEDKLQASVRCLAPGGQFLEIGIFDISNDNSLCLDFIRKGASFHGVMLDKVFENVPQQKALIINLLKSGINNGSVKPLVRTAFDAEDFERAFRLVAGGNHIGKVVIKIRSEEAERICVPKPKLHSVMPRCVAE